jgi:hypothetical protein
MNEHPVRNAKHAAQGNVIPSRSITRYYSPIIFNKLFRFRKDTGTSDLSIIMA